jgi:acyl-homoserine lactone acylase PvdQ
VNFKRGWLANWNNQPAQGWQRERSYTAIDNADDLYRTLDPSQPAVPDPDPKGGLVNPDRLVDFEDLSGNLRYGAFKHHRHTWFGPFLPADAELSSALARDAAAVVREWDGFNTDRDDDGKDDSAGRTIVDEWVSRMRAAAFRDDLGDESGWAREDLLWHLLKPDDTVQQRFDWLGGETPQALAARSFDEAVAALADEFGNEDPSTWKGDTDLEHYQRLNADTFTDLAAGTAGVDNSEDSGFPGDVPDHISMDRGTYNHVVEYQDRPARTGPLGQSRSKAGSVIPPGQSGFIDLAGRESEHYEDQLALYVGWTYKPMPLTYADALRLAESETVIRR